MKRTALLVAGVLLLLTSLGLAFQAQSDGPYKVLKTARITSSQTRSAGDCISRAEPRKRNRQRTQGPKCRPSKSV
jgi:hypothetical protein